VKTVLCCQVDRASLASSLSIVVDVKELVAISQSLSSFPLKPSSTTTSTEPKLKASKRTSAIVPFSAHGSQSHQGRDLTGFPSADTVQSGYHRRSIQTARFISITIPLIRQPPIWSTLESRMTALGLGTIGIGRTTARVGRTSGPSLSALYHQRQHNNTT